MQYDYDIIICGGGLSGLWCAVELSGRYKILLIDPDSYPRHKMCGEYLSAEVAPLLASQGVDINQLTDVKIDRFEISLRDGKQMSSPLPLGGYGISRYCLDYSLYQKIQATCDVLEDKVVDLQEQDTRQTVITTNKQFTCRQVIVATGKRSILDKKLHRDFIQSKSEWLAVKMHYKYDMPLDRVELHNFEGGYAGLSRVENGAVNLCYLTHFDSFKKIKDIKAFEGEVLAKNAQLKDFFDNATPLWEQPITISQIAFGKKEITQTPFLYIGDTAGLIHPLCGNGMAMALHSAHLAANALIPFLNGENTRSEMIKNYSNKWQQHFSSRMRYGSYIQTILTRVKSSLWMYKILSYMPFLLPIIIKKTHGKSIVP